jgi:hypothetical protein
MRESAVRMKALSSTTSTRIGGRIVRSWLMSSKSRLQSPEPEAARALVPLEFIISSRRVCNRNTANE